MIRNLRSLSALLFTCLAMTAVAAETPSAFSSETIDTGLVVKDLKKSVKFYTEAIGFKEAPGFSVPGAWTKDVGLTEGETLNITVLTLGDSKTASKLKLMEVPSAEPKSGGKKFITSRIGIRYLTIQVSDIDQAINRLKKAGVTPATKGGIIALPEGFPKGIYLTLVSDPDGNKIELVGPKSSK